MRDCHVETACGYVRARIKKRRRQKQAKMQSEFLEVVINWEIAGMEPVSEDGLDEDPIDDLPEDRRGKRIDSSRPCSGNNSSATLIPKRPATDILP